MRCPAAPSAILLAFAALLATLLAALPVSRSVAQVPVPVLQGRVTDLTRTLDAAQTARLDAALADIERRSGAQVAVLLVETTRPEPIEAFGIRVAEAWKIGRGVVDGRRVDDGVIVLVAKADRAVRIEVGYGLEGVIPDAIAKRIIEASIVPRFREGDFAGGLQAAVADLGRLIRGEALPPTQAPPADFDAMTVLIAAFVIGSFAVAIGGRLLGAGLGAIVAGVGSVLGGASILAVLGVVVVAFLAVLLLGGGRPGRGGFWTGGHGGRGGGFGGGGFGGGFGGGGGGFGGGGASGRW